MEHVRIPLHFDLVSPLYTSKSILEVVHPVASSSPSFGSLVTEEVTKLSIPCARTHFFCFPYLDSILLIGGYCSFLLSHLVFLRLE